MDSATGYVILMIAIAITPGATMALLGGLPKKCLDALMRREWTYTYICLAAIILECLIYKWICC
jgi:hypothetical protein